MYYLTINQYFVSIYLVNSLFHLTDEHSHTATQVNNSTCTGGKLNFLKIAEESHACIYSVSCLAYLLVFVSSKGSI